MLRSCLVLGKGVGFATAVSESREEALQLSYLLRVSLHSRTAIIERGDILLHFLLQPGDIHSAPGQQPPSVE